MIKASVRPAVASRTSVKAQAMTPKQLAQSAAVGLASLALTGSAFAGANVKLVRADRGEKFDFREIWVLPQISSRSSSSAPFCSRRPHRDVVMDADGVMRARADGGAWGICAQTALSDPILSLSLKSLRQPVLTSSPCFSSTRREPTTDRSSSSRRLSPSPRETASRGPTTPDSRTTSCSMRMPSRPESTPMPSPTRTT